jgi:5-(carboxyamino)imidazole ribonucleotide mutase
VTQGGARRAAYNFRLGRIVEQGVNDTDPGSDGGADPGPGRGEGRLAPQVGVVMGSASDWATMQAAAALLAEFGVAYEARVVSAHRMPDELYAYAEAAQPRGLRAIIAGAGGAAHLPGMLAAKTLVPVLGVPVASRHLQGLDSLYSIVQMPRGIPVATFAIGEAGAANAALFALALLAAGDAPLRARLEAFRARQRDEARAMSAQLELPPQPAA